MAKQNINVGTTANDKKGDSLRAAFVKVNANFTELYAALGLTDVTLNLGAFTFTGSTMSTDDSTNIVIDKPITVNGEITVDGDITPKTNLGASLGTPTKQFKSLYVSTNTVFLGGVPLSLEAGTNELTINNVPVSQTINYADIPNAPKDLSDLTDNSGSLGGGVTSYNDLTNKPTLFSGSYNDLTNKPDLAGTYQFSVAADDSTQRVISTDEVIKFIGAGGITTASDAEGNITISKISELVSATVPTVGSTASAGEAGITYSNKIAIFTEGAFTVGVWTDVQPGWTVTDNNGFTDTIASRGGFGAASFVTTVNNWPAPASGKTYVFTSPGYQLGYTNPIEITVGNNDWSFNNDGSLTFPDNTVQTTAAQAFSFSVAADDSTQRAISNNELIKFIGAGGITTASDAEGNITITGSGGSVSSLVNGAYTVSLGSTGTLTVPANGIITAPINQEFQLQAKDANSVLRNEINLDPNNGTYMSVWRDGETSFSSADWGSGSWNNEEGLGAARFTDAQGLQNFWLTGPGSIEGVAIEASINGGARTPNVFYDNNNGETYGVFLGLDAVPPGGQGTTVPITSLVFYYRLQSKINMDVTGGGEILVDAKAMDIDLRTTLNLDLRANENLNLRGLGAYPVRIYTNGITHKWEFDNTGSLTLPREGKIYGIGDGVGGGDRYGYISWDGNSSGDGSGFNTMRLVPDLQGLEDLDQYIILDPTGGVPGHIHIRAGGTQDNSLAHLFLGGEHSNVKISAGLNPPVTVMSNDNAWTFGTDGDLTVPGDIKSTANTSIIIDGGVLFANVTVQTVDSFGGGVWRMFISSSAYPTLGSIVQVGDTATTAWGTPITVTITSIVQDIGAGTWALHTNQDITTGFFFGPGTQTITINSTQVKTWTFSTDKSLTFPDGTKQTTAAQAFSFSVAADDSTQRAVSNNELVKFIGAGGITTSSDAEGNITINGSGGGAYTAETFNTDQITLVGNRITTTVTNANLELECNGTGGVVINTVAEATTASTARSVGYLGIPASTVTTTATLTIADAGEHIYLTTTSNTITIPANASVAYPIGTTLTFIAGPSATTTTIAITSDTMYLAGTGTTGSRTLAAHGMATAVKVAATTWYINGTGLT
jgi:hypothetical protein